MHYNAFYVWYLFLKILLEFYFFKYIETKIIEDKVWLYLAFDIVFQDSGFILIILLSIILQTKVLFNSFKILLLFV